MSPRPTEQHAAPAAAEKAPSADTFTGEAAPTAPAPSAEPSSDTLTERAADSPAEAAPSAATKKSTSASKLLDRSSPVRTSVSWLYGGGRWLHRSLYDAGVLKRNRLPRPVVCVGNLTVGGTGKTPFLIALVESLRERGRRPAILSRGYRAIPPATVPRIVSDGAGALCPVEQAGDEPHLLARNCPRTPVVICTRRTEAGRAAIADFNPDLLLLDDGFQHEALHRDVNIVLWDARDEPSKMRRLPAGRLREGLGALARADAIVLTHLEYLREGLRRRRAEDIRFELTRHAPEAAFFEVRTELIGWRPLNPATPGGEASESAVPRSFDRFAGRTLLVSGLARPEGFETMAREAGVEVVGHLMLPDHSAYGATELAAIESEAVRAQADRVLTTEKDAVKLEGLSRPGQSPHTPLDVAMLRMRVVETERWAAFLDALPR